MGPEDALGANRERQRTGALQWEAELRRLQAEERMLAREVNEALPIFRLLGISDIRANLMRADRHGIVTLRRMRGVCCQWRSWADAELATLPRVVAIGGELLGDEPEDLSSVEDDADDIEYPYESTVTVESLCLHTMMWSSKDTGVPPLRVPRSSAALCQFQDGRIVIAGGWRSFVEMGDCPRSAELCRPKSNRWESLPDLPEKRWYHAAVALSDRVLIIGGCTEPGAGRVGYEPLASVVSLTLDAEPSEGHPERSGPYNWVELQPMQHACASCAATVLPCGEVFVVGGSTMNWRASSEADVGRHAEVYSPEADTWSALPSMSVPRNGPACTVLPSGKVAVFGGEDTDDDVYEYDQDMSFGEVFDPKQRTWERLPLLGFRDRDTPEATHAAPVPGGLIVVGGTQRARGEWSLAPAQLFDEVTGRWYDLPGQKMVEQRVRTQLATRRSS